MIKLDIDPEFLSLIPPLTADEYAQLEKNIVEDGIRDPLVIWPQQDGTDILIDGHNRLKISVAHGGIKFDVKRMYFANRDEARQWIILNQFGRRNLSAYDRSLLALKLKPMIAEQARAQQIRKSVSQKSVEQKPIDTQKELAKAAGVSHDTIHKVETIEKKADIQTKQQVRSGEKSINQAYNEIKAREIKRMPTAEEYQEMVQERHEAVKNAKTISLNEIKQDKQDREFLGEAIKHEILKAIAPINKLYILITSDELDVTLMSDSAKRKVLYDIDVAMRHMQVIRERIERGDQD